MKFDPYCSVWVTHRTDETGLQTAQQDRQMVTIDLHDKKRAYCRNSVQEYMVWRTLEGQLDWFVMQVDEYVALTPDAQGIVRSQVFPGLWLAVPALLAGDLPKVLSVLQAGLNSIEHQDFVQQLVAERDNRE